MSLRADLSRALAAARDRAIEAGDLVADGGQHARQDVADKGATRIADVEWPGRVGAHELDVDAAGLIHRAAPV